MAEPNGGTPPTTAPSSSTSAAEAMCSIFYNRQRRHSALGYLTPQEAIDRYSQQHFLVA